MEWFTTDDGKYRIESLSPTTFPGALRVIREAFCREEAAAVGSGLSNNPEATEELLELCADAALDGVSLVAVAVDSGEVVSACFNKIQLQVSDASEKPFFEIFAEERCNQSPSRSLIKFMANVDARCNFFEKYGVDCSLEVMFLATLREYRYQKLGTLLCHYSIVIARRITNAPFVPIEVDDLGSKYSHLQPRKHIETYPKICQAIWTTKGSQRIGKVFNFTVHLTVPYSEFVCDGKTYSERIGDDTAFCQVAALLL